MDKIMSVYWFLAKAVLIGVICSVIAMTLVSVFITDPAKQGAIGISITGGLTGIVSALFTRRGWI